MLILKARNACKYFDRMNRMLLAPGDANTYVEDRSHMRQEARTEPPQRKA